LLIQFKLFIQGNTMSDTIPNPQGMPAGAPPMDPAAAAPMAPAAAQTNANMPVQLTLQVGSVSMELGKLLEMGAGMILSDEVMSFFPKVRVLAGDQAVAEGELVQIEGKVGLRVSKLLG
jgi:flagellar motor switch/type III secretory pathway protein FliN